MRLFVMAVTLSMGAQTALASEEAPQAAGPFVEFLVNFLPWCLVFLFIWFFVFRKLNRDRANADLIKQNLERSLAHMDRVEQQNQRIIELLENIGKK